MSSVWKEDVGILLQAKSKWRTYNSSNVFSIVSEVHKRVCWEPSVWLLKWSEESTNQSDCCHLLLKRHTWACVQHDYLRSSVEAVHRGTSVWFRTISQMPRNQNARFTSRIRRNPRVIGLDGFSKTPNSNSFADSHYRISKSPSLHPQRLVSWERYAILALFKCNSV